MEKITGHEKKILVTGGSGFLGWSLIQQVLEDSEADEIICFDINPLPDEGKQETRIKYIKGDVTNLQQLFDALIGVETVYHAASIVSWGSRIPLEKIEKVNIKGTENVIEAARKCGVQRLM
jgi:nucleoside-diphosphate-sugar epimerase